MHQYSFYVIDDLRHCEANRPLIAESGLTLEEAVRVYSELPDTQEKVLGITADGSRWVDLVLCRRVSPEDGASQNLLLATYRGSAFWRRDAEAVEAVAVLKRELSISLMLQKGRLVPC
jgi:hypothetical protein